jgi:hypothetical protein
MLKVVKGKQYITEMTTGKLVIKHRKNIKKAFMNYGSDITKILKSVIETGKRSGRVYFIKGRAHTASAPGEAPANISGKLANSFIYKARMSELLVASTAFSTKGFPYPGYLEKELNRPFFEKTNKENSYILERDLQRYGL